MRTSSPKLGLLLALLVYETACDTMTFRTGVTSDSNTTGRTNSGTTGGKQTPSVSLKCPVAAATGNGSMLLSDLSPPGDLLQPPRRRLVSGLSWRQLSAPRQAQAWRPSTDDTVEVHYTGWDSHGRAFDSTLTERHPVRLALRQATRGWQELLRSMRVGEERRVWMPASLAYDGPIPAGAPGDTLVFDVLLVRVMPGGNDGA